jgi:hypothetical protein
LANGNDSVPACTTVRDLSLRSCSAERMEGVSAGPVVRLISKRVSDGLRCLAA